MCLRMFEKYNTKIQYGANIVVRVGIAGRGRLKTSSVREKKR